MTKNLLLDDRAYLLCEGFFSHVPEEIRRNSEILTDIKPSDHIEDAKWMSHCDIEYFFCPFAIPALVLKCLH